MFKKYLYYTILVVFITAGTVVLLPKTGSAAEQADDTPAAPEQVNLTNGTAGNFLSGQFARQTGDVDAAIKFLRRAYQNAPDNTEIPIQLQGLLLLDGNVSEAVKIAKSLATNTDVEPLTSLLLCLDAVKKSDFEQARTILDEAKIKSDGQLWLPLASAWVDVGRNKLLKPVTFDGFGSEVTQAAALANYHMALINARAGFTEEAFENFKNAIADTNNPPSRIMAFMAKFYEDNGQPPALQSLVKKWDAIDFDINQNAGESLSAFTPLDGLAEILFTMGNVVQNAGSPQDAIIYLNMALYVKPDFSLATIGLGDAYSDLKQFSKANTVYSSLKESSVYYARAQLRMAMNENQNGRWQTAIKMMEKLSIDQPSQYEPLVAIGDLLRTHQQFSQAIDAYTRALARIEHIESYHWPIYFARGVCHERQKNWNAAEADLQQALILRPNQPDVMNYLGYSLLMQNEDMEKAYKLITDAFTQRPNDPQIADSMGWAMFHMEKYEEAVEYLEKALEKMPNDPTINDHLGDVYWMLGRKTEARYQWKRSLNFVPDPQDAVAIEKKLKEGIAKIRSQVNSPIVADRKTVLTVQ